MTNDDRPWRALEGAARRLNGTGPSLLRAVGRELKREAERIGIRALDRVVSRLSGRAVHTEPTPKLPDPRPKELEEGPAPRPRRPLRRMDSTPPLAAERPASSEASGPPQPSARPVPRDSTPPPRPTIPPPPLDPPAPAMSADTPSWLPAQRAASEARPQTASDPLPSLPDRFGIDRIVLLAGDSEWVFTYWEIDAARLQAMRGPQELRGELRLLDDRGALVARAYVDPHQGRQHLRIPKLGGRYKAELRLIDGTPDGILVSESRTVTAKAAAADPPALP
ncbi:MAG: DUF4912 domain-containing protein [Myxococcota bacterium]